MNVEDEEKLPDGGHDEKKQYRYCVLYTPALAQDKLRKVLKKRLPEDRGTVFSPSMETYRRDCGGELKLKAIFPGYLFIRSDMRADELHKFIRAHRREFMSFIRELRLSERMASDDPDGDADYDYTVSDLKDDETEFLDFLLDIGRTGGEISEATREALEKREGIKGQRDVAELPTEGLLRMSYGYQESRGKWKVVKGPLRAYESHIADVNNHDKKAYLDFEIGGHIVRAGFDVKPKRHWFPEDKKAPEVLSDGTEVDLEALKRKIMRLGKSGK